MNDPLDRAWSRFGSIDVGDAMVPPDAIYRRARRRTRNQRVSAVAAAGALLFGGVTTYALATEGMVTTSTPPVAERPVEQATIPTPVPPESPSPSTSAAEQPVTTPTTEPPGPTAESKTTATSPSATPSAPATQPTQEVTTADGLYCGRVAERSPQLSSATVDVTVYVPDALGPAKALPDDERHVFDVSPETTMNLTPNYDGLGEALDALIVGKRTVWLQVVDGEVRFIDEIPIDKTATYVRGCAVGDRPI